MRLDYFQLIDRVAELSLPELSIAAEATVPMESTVFEGHFPGFPLMPGVLLIETMAQASGWLLIATQSFSHMPFLAQVKEAKLRAFVVPGAKLDVRARLIHQGSGYAVTRASIAVDGKPACDAELRFRVTAFPSQEFRAAMLAVAERIALPTGMPADA